MGAAHCIDAYYGVLFNGFHCPNYQLEGSMAAQNPTPQSATDVLIAKQKEYIWPCAATYYKDPMALERGEGMHVWDTEGNRYLDCFGGVLTTSVGHARPEVVEAVSNQVATIAHTSTLY